MDDETRRRLKATAQHHERTMGHEVVFVRAGWTCASENAEFVPCEVTEQNYDLNDEAWDE